MTNAIIHASHVDNISSTPYSLDLLPDTLFELLTISINDARNLNWNNFQPASERWYWPSEEGTVLVCLAGCVLARAFLTSPDRALFPHMFVRDTSRKLYAINHMSRGNFSSAYESLNSKPAPLSLMKRLNRLQCPTSCDFFNFERFFAHLDSLEAVIAELREIEEADQRR